MLFIREENNILMAREETLTTLQLTFGTILHFYMRQIKFDLCSRMNESTIYRKLIETCASDVTREMRDKLSREAEE